MTGLGSPRRHSTVVRVCATFRRLCSAQGRQPCDTLIQSFEGRLRTAYPDAICFLSVADARSKIETWRQHYSDSRSHTALG